MATKIKSDETQDTIVVASWMRLHRIVFYHIPNEAKRSIATAMIEKEMGLESGVPDFCIAMARKGYHGLYIEMKTEKGKATENQLKWLKKLREQGYATYICRSSKSAIKCISEYLDIKGELIR